MRCATAHPIRAGATASSPRRPGLPAASQPRQGSPPPPGTASPPPASLGGTLPRHRAPPHRPATAHQKRRCLASAQAQPSRRPGPPHQKAPAAHLRNRGRSSDFCNRYARVSSIIFFTVSWISVSFSLPGIHCWVITGTGISNLASCMACSTCLGPSGAQP